MYMARSTWTQVRDYFKKHDLVIIGVGSTECHGRHNPLGTDTMAPDRILELLEQRDGTYLVAPTLPYGATDDLVGYPGTVSLGVQGLYDVLSSITRQLFAYGARRFVFLNGHNSQIEKACAGTRPRRRQSSRCSSRLLACPPRYRGAGPRPSPATCRRKQGRWPGWRSSPWRRHARRPMPRGQRRARGCDACGHGNVASGLYARLGGRGASPTD